MGSTSRHLWLCTPALLSFPSSFSNPARVSAFVSAIMAPQLNAAQHILIKSLLKQGFENKLIASEASCSVRAVQRIRLKQFEMPTPRTNRVGRCSCITSPMQGALCDKLIEQSFLYRCEMADFLYMLRPQYHLPANRTNKMRQVSRESDPREYDPLHWLPGEIVILISNYLAVADILFARMMSRFWRKYLGCENLHCILLWPGQV